MNVVFQKAPADARVIISLRSHQEELPIIDLTSEETATRNLQPKYYSVTWRLFGELGAKVTVTWAAEDGRDGTLIDNFEIDVDDPDTTLWPDGPWKSDGRSFLQLKRFP